MKNTIKKILVVAFMFGTLISYANLNSTSYEDAKRVRVEFKSVKKGQTLTIKNKDGITIYNQLIINSGKYSRMFNLNALKNGSYTAELNKDFEITVKPFLIKKGTISFIPSKEYTIFKPVIRTEKNSVLISKINFDRKPVKVILYYNDELIYSKTITENKDILNKVYRLSNTEKGDYKVIVYCNNKEYTKEFKI
ncbi:DUF3244 domain-containing protein [Polaribacter sp.]|uniref:DUF3244 domain-containing protein n=1 Tax=Polaribacter sp. TaxID=1920175 RepID=UPI003EF42712